MLSFRAALLLTPLFLSFQTSLALAQTQIELEQSKYLAPGTGAVVRTGASKLADVISVKDFGAVGDGVTDDLPAIEKALAAVAGSSQRVFFPAGTYGVSNTITIPSKTSIFGAGRGDALADNTVIKALPVFPSSGTVIVMGDSNPSFGVRLENLTVDGSSIAGICLSNSVSEEQSAGRDLLLANCASAGLSISTYGSQNSGPFEDLEIYPGSGPTVTTGTVCVRVTGSIAFRGIRGLTCNAGTQYSSRPNVGLAIDGGGTYSDIHVEHVTTAISLGSSANSADSTVVSNGQFGPDVATGVAITSLPAMNNQNITISGMSCGGCASLLTDAELGTNITSNSLGLYAIGDGAGSTKGLLSTSYGVGSQLFGPFHTVGTASFGPANVSPSGGTVNIFDATPNTGVTTVVETAGAAQTGSNLFEWHADAGQTIAYIDQGGGMSGPAFQATNGAASLSLGGVFVGYNMPIAWSSTGLGSGVLDTGLARSSPANLEVTNGGGGLGSLAVQSLQVSSSGSQPACASGNRGSFWLLQGAAGVPDHLQVCSKSASNSYGWTTVF